MDSAPKVSARHLGGDAWEVSLPKRRSAVRHRDGVRPRRTVHAATEAEAVALGSEVFAREVVAYRMGLTMDLADLAVHYVDHAEREGIYSADTAADYRNLLLRYVVPFFARDADKATAIDIEGLYSFLMANGGIRAGGVGANTIHKLNTVLRAAYAFLVREGVVASSPMPQVRLPRRTHPAKRALTEREFARVLDGLEEALGDGSLGTGAILRRNCLFGAYLDLHIGARVGEVCALARADVRALEESLRIEHSMTEKGGLRRKRPKTPSSMRTVALGAEAFQRLREHYAWQAGYLSEAQRDSDATPVCCTASGGFIRPREMSAEFKRFCSSVGVELARGESFHILRHTHATLLLANKVNPGAVKERLGHSKIETTYGYAHVMPGEDEGAARDYSGIVRRARQAGELR